MRKIETPSSASQKYNIKRTTLNSRLKKVKTSRATAGDDSGNSSECEIPVQKFQSKYSSAQIFTANEEEDLAKYMKKCSHLQYGLTYKKAREFAFEYAVINKKNYPTTWDINKCAGEDWISNFMRRNQTLSLRKPENTSLARSTGFNKAAVNEFYANLKSLMDKFKFNPDNIYNLDESGISTVLDTPKVK